MRLSVKLLFCFVFLLTAVLLFCAVAYHIDIVAFKTKTFSTYNCFNDKVERPITRFETQIAVQNTSERSGTWHGQRSIPKIIHQIWNDEILPEEFVKSVKSLVRDNPPPEWNYYFWTKESGLKFIKDKYPYLHDKATSIGYEQHDIVDTKQIQAAVWKQVKWYRKRIRPERPYQNQTKKMYRMLFVQ